MSHDDVRDPSRWIIEETPQPVSLVRSALAAIWSPVHGFFEWFGELGIFIWRVLRSVTKPPFEGRELFRQLDEVGSKSFPLGALAGTAVGPGLALESRY